MLNTAFVFPGQGSQSVGMLSDFLPQYPLITDTFKEVSDAIGYDVWDLAQNGPVEQLNQTEYTQVVMLTADVAVSRLLAAQGIPMPKYMAGHSLGEYAALVSAHSLSLADAACLVARRGQIMQNAVPLGEGAMAAIVGLTDEQVVQLCMQASTSNARVNPANYNAIGQVVVAGDKVAIDRVMILAEEAGAGLVKLIPVSVPCHCSLLNEAADLFAEDLATVDFKKPIVNVISNVDLSSYESADHIRTQLRAQLYSPVRWVETIQLFKNKGVDFIIESGPGRVLSGLTKRIDRSINTISIYDTISLDQLIEQQQ